MEICKQGEIVKNQAENAISADRPAPRAEPMPTAKIIIDAIGLALLAGFLALAWAWYGTVRANLPAILGALTVAPITCTEDGTGDPISPTSK